MSSRIIASSLLNMNSERARTNSVLPTPVGPMKRNTPMGWRGSLRPARARRTALATLITASSWPTMRLWIPSSMCSRRSVSSMPNRETGMPVHMLTTSATSSSVTTGWSCSCPWCHSSSAFSSFSMRRSSRSRSSAAYSYCWLAMASSFSLRTFSSTFVVSLTERGAVLVRSRTREAASSMTSMALSGRNRSETNRKARLVAWVMASSEMVRWWCSS